MSSASRRVLDWGKIKAILSPEDFKVVSEQRARNTEFTRILSTPVPKIDFEQYKSVLKNQDIVRDIENAVNKYAPKRADVSEVLKSLDAQEKESITLARETVKKVESTVAGFKKDLKDINNLAHYDDIKPEDVYQAAPGLEKVYHDRLREGKIYHDQHNFGEKFI